MNPTRAQIEWELRTCSVQTIADAYNTKNPPPHFPDLWVPANEVFAALRAAEEKLGLCMAARNELQERINARDETIEALDAELVKHAEDDVDNRVTTPSPTEDT